MYRRRRYTYKNDSYFVEVPPFGGTMLDHQKLIKGEWKSVMMMGFDENRKIVVEAAKRLIVRAYQTGKFTSDIFEIDDELQALKKERKKKRKR